MFLLSQTFLNKYETRIGSKQHSVLILSIEHKGWKEFCIIQAVDPLLLAPISKCKIQDPERSPNL